MYSNSKSILKSCGYIIALVIFFILAIWSYKANITQSVDVKQIELGDIVVLSDNNKEVLRDKTIEHIKKNLKAPSTAKFEKQFEYNCDEANIIKVKGYVDSQNSFGVMIRGKFICEYFAIKNDITTLVVLIYDDTELFNIKETYIEEYKNQQKLDNIQQSGRTIDQEKLEYIKENFNNDELNDVGRIRNVLYNEKESNIDVQVIAKNSRNSNEQKEYWSNFNICSILHYFNDFDIIGIIKMTLYDIDNNKILELRFNDNFIKNKWKDNSQINLVKELFGDDYIQF